MNRARRLSNNGAMKRMLNGYMKGHRRTTNSVVYDKKDFVPFIDERDHLGNIIDSDVRTEIGGSNFMKKSVRFSRSKGSIKVSVKDEVPRRWLEQVGSLSEAKSADLANAYEITSFDGSAGATAASAFNNIVSKHRFNNFE